MMTEREKLIKLIKEAKKNEAFETLMADIDSVIDMPHGDEYLACHLLANGVIVPPCKVGETLYFLYDNTFANRPNLTPHIYETNDWYFDIDTKGISILPRSIHSYKGKHHYYLGETVFLSREDAEKALRKEDEGK